ncbi:hypothetical protein ACFQGW_05865 [Xanthomonas theicola]|uniref:hypothetical protein n=1 Tax=Xanthomonas theicola TaxID=56464 RepID=UPI00361FB398
MVSGSAEKLERARRLGADHGIDRSAEDWLEAVLRITHDQERTTSSNSSAGRIWARPCRRRRSADTSTRSACWKVSKSPRPQAR